jgi:hypothetical protein
MGRAQPHRVPSLDSKGIHGFGQLLLASKRLLNE